MMSAPEFPELFIFSMDHNTTDSMWPGNDFISFFPPPMDEYEMPMAENATRLTTLSLNQEHIFPQDNPGYASLPAAPFNAHMAHPQGDRPECMPFNESLSPSEIFNSLEQPMQQSTSAIQTWTRALETKMAFFCGRIGQMETRLDKIDNRLDNIDDRLNSFLENMDSRLVKMDERMLSLDESIKSVNGYFLEVIQHEKEFLAKTNGH